MPHNQWNRADISNDKSRKQVNKNAIWPAEKPDTISDRSGKQLNNIVSPAEEGGH